VSASRVALVQMRCEKGAIGANLDAMAAHLRECVARGAEIVCFPEASITGYVDPGRYPEAVVRLDGPEVARFVALTRDCGMTALAGIIEANPDGLPFITQVAAREGGVVGVYRKRTIPEDERALYAPGTEAAAFVHAGILCGMAICADIERAEVFADCARQGARIVFEAAAPGLYGEQATRDWGAGYAWWRSECETKLGAYARANRIFVAVATQAGRTRDEDFPGGGYVFGPGGTCLTSTDDWSEGTLYATVALD
jgi:predicted amidohydrolase